MSELQLKCIQTLRTLAIDAVEKANSGHPGLPLGCAAIAHTIWSEFLQHNPKNPSWFNRDRFVLSAGHGSALLYALLHIHGYDLSLDDIKNFRQWESKTPGHPEYGETPGVEATTGPLGQGFAMGIGMAIAEKYLADYFNYEELEIVNHHTYAIVSDGDLMEGVTAEAASLAGHLKLGKIIYVYDDNKISIDGSTDITFTENVESRFLAYNWQVLRVADGNNCDELKNAIQNAKKEQSKPTLIITKTHIGYGSPKQDTSKVHGSPLGKDGVEKTKENFGWPTSPDFYIPDEVKEYTTNFCIKGKSYEDNWKLLFQKYQEKFPELANKLEMIVENKLPENWYEDLLSLFKEDEEMATRNASGKVMNVIAQKLFHFTGGSADLAESNKTDIKSSGDFGNERNGRNIRFGIREHAMAAIVNGMALHKGTIPFAATFLVFSDYMRPAIRLAALMKVPSLFVFTHDSIALGEDGPTHQPVEQLMSLRMIPGVVVMRPADAIETIVMWKQAILSKKPVCLAFTRQNVPVLSQYRASVLENAGRGAYTLVKDEDAKAIIIATGSEVGLALEAQKQLLETGIACNVVSMPSWELFDEQSKEYQKEVLPDDLPKLAIEAGVTLGWQKYVGQNGSIIGLDRFGASAPWKTAYENLGFSVSNVIAKIKEMLN